MLWKAWERVFGDDNAGFRSEEKEKGREAWVGPSMYILEVKGYVII